MDNIKHRAVIEFLIKEEKKPKEIYERMVKVYGNSSPSYTTVKKWSAEFLRGRQSLEDDTRSGRPVDVTTDDMCSAVEKCVMENRLSPGTLHLRTPRLRNGLLNFFGVGSLW